MPRAAELAAQVKRARHRTGIKIAPLPLGERCRRSLLKNNARLLMCCWALGAQGRHGPGREGDACGRARQAADGQQDRALAVVAGAGLSYRALGGPGPRAQPTGERRRQNGEKPSSAQTECPARSVAQRRASADPPEFAPNPAPTSRSGRVRRGSSRFSIASVAAVGDIARSCQLAAGGEVRHRGGRADEVSEGRMKRRINSSSKGLFPRSRREVLVRCAFGNVYGSFPGRSASSAVGGRRASDGLGVSSRCACVGISSCSPAARAAGIVRRTA